MSLSQCLDKSQTGLNVVCDSIVVKSGIVNRLEGLSGNINLTSPANSITIVKSGQDIQLEAVAVVPLDGVDSLNTLKNDVNLTSPNGSVAINTAGQNITLQTAVYQATYYKSVQQPLVNANTDITFDLTGSWNNDGGYITHTNGTANFTVVVAGLYQLEFNLSVNANGATWNNGVNKATSIDITRTGNPEQAVISNNALTALGQSYQQAVSSSFYLEVGDIINLRSTLAFATATPFAVGILNTFDLNTFFTWQYITAGTPPVPP